MKNLRFNLSFRRYRISIISIFFLLLGLLSYYLFYVPSRELQLNERNFRSLQKLEENVSRKQFNMLKVGQTFIKSSKPYSSSGSRASGSKFYKVPDGYLVFNRADTVQKDQVRSNAPAFSILPAGDSSLLVITQFFDGDYNLVDSIPDGPVYRTEITTSLASFMKSVVSFDFFESYLLVYDTQVVYESQRSGIATIRMDSLVSAKHPVAGSSIKEVLLAGKKYKLFIYPVQIEQGKSSFLCGLLPTSLYNREKFHLPDDLIVFAAFAILFVLLSFPLLKLWLISKDEQLNSLDVISSFVTLVFAASLGVMVLLDLYAYNGRDFSERDQVLRRLNDSIRSQLLDEIHLALQQLDEFDKVFQEQDAKETMRGGMVALRRSGSRYSMPADSLQNFRLLYPDFKFALWIDQKGNELFYLTPGQETPALSNYASRPYFQRARKNQLWDFPLDRSRRFFMDGIYSYTTGNFRAALSTRSRLTKEGDTVVAAITAPLRSVMNPIMPIGFQFCIIDEQAKVLFHSDTRKNLNENFARECDQNRDLVAALYSSQDYAFDANYLSTNSRMYIQPLDDLPLSIVTFYDKSIFSSANLQTIELAFILLFANIVVIILISGICLASKKKKSKLKRPGFDLEWIWPDREKTMVYGYNLLLNIFICILLILIYSLSDSGWVKLLSTLSAATFSILFFYLSNHYEQSFREFRRQNAHLVNTALFLVVIVFLVSLPHIENWYFFTGYNGLLLVSGITCWLRITRFHRKKKESRSFEKPDTAFARLEHYFSTRKYSNLYAYMLFSWTVTNAVIPSIEFFELAYDREQEIICKAQALTVARASHEVLPSDGVSPSMASADYTGAFLKSRILAGRPVAGNCMFTGDSLKKHSRSWALNTRIPHNEWTRKTNLLLDPPDSVGNLVWFQCKDSIVLKYTNSVNSDHPRYVATNFKKFRIPSVINLKGLPDRSFFRVPAIVLAFWLIVLLAVIWLAIKIFSRQVFGFDWMPMQSKVSIARYLLKYQSDLHQNTVWADQRKLFLTALPGASAVGQFLEAITADDNEHYRVIDCANLRMDTRKPDPAGLSGESFLILDHFDFAVLEKKMNDLKLNWLQAAMMADARCLVISAMSAVDLIDSIKTAELNFLQKQAQVKSPDILLPDFSWEWEFLLREYKQIYCPLRPFGESPSANSAAQETKTHFLRDFLDAECAHGSFLTSLKGLLVQKWNEPQAALQKRPRMQSKIEEEMILKIQSLATPYYQSLWDSLGASEKYMLYDIAKEGVLNTKNAAAINKLLAKGLLVYDDRLRVMNESFRNFILTGVSPEELMQLDRMISETGTWSRLRTPLLIILIGVLAFMLVTQQEMFNKVILWMGTLLGGVATVSRIFTVIPSGSQGSSSSNK